MLFNSYEFLFIFLPVIVGLFTLMLKLKSHRAATVFLIAASLFFYGYHDVHGLVVLACSIGVNQCFGRALYSATGQASPKCILFSAILFNLSLLGYFKYSGFVVENFSRLTGHSIAPLNAVLPLGISFFTFQQIAFLVDVHRGRVHKSSWMDYLLFVSFFPYVTSGPISYHSESGAQLQRLGSRGHHSEDISVGLTLLSMGLFKKVLVADSLAAYVTPVFAHANTESVGLLAAWQAALAFTGQIYFDFSGYTDMALGLARMFSVTLPMNFNSPYRSCSVVEFWRRWHMTLSRFLRDFIYIPMGGNRRSVIRQYANVTAVMLLCGLWHGAGWTFVAWGGLHGAMIVVNHLWKRYRQTWPFSIASSIPASSLRSWLLTFLAIVASWVLFRAENFDAAFGLLTGMIGLNGIRTPHGAISAIEVDLGGWFLVITALLVSILGPNSMQVLYRYKPCLDEIGSPPPNWMQWSPKVGTAVVFGLMMLVSALGMWRASEFVYYRF